MALNLKTLLKTVLPKKSNPAGTSITPTYNSSAPKNTLTLPAYREHITDIFTSRQANDSRVLLKSLFVHDPDMSAAVNAFLTVSNTDPLFIVKDANGVIDRTGQQDLNVILQALTSRFDYSTGFQLVPSIKAISENLRYMILLRGGLATELLFNKAKLPYGVRVLDLATFEWHEETPGVYKPQQIVPGASERLSLDVASIFVTFFRRDPTSIYTYSPFVSSINTIAARQQVINDLYRIMRFTGFPRIEVTVMEEVLRKNVPVEIINDPTAINSWIQDQISTISATLSDMRADQAFVHTDSLTAKILNDKNSSAGMNIDSVVGTLNAQNQAGLRAMSTILGRGESGVNTASVEARVFAMSADELNLPVADLWSQMLTMAIRAAGHEESTVECTFLPAEMRSQLELEPQLIMKSTRLLQDLSRGIISDDEYHMAMYHRIRPDSSPELSGTNFMNPAQSAQVDVTDVSPNADPLGRSLTAPGSKGAKSNGVAPKKSTVVKK